jgi:hypothetical protein
MNLGQEESAAAIATALNQVGPRVKRLGTHRKLVADVTGISKSTLSRLETGAKPRRPCQGQDGHSADPPARRDAGVEDHHPDEQVDT